MAQKQRWRFLNDRAFRDTVIFVTGFVGAMHDIFTGIDSPSRFAFFGALMGLAFYLRANGHA